MRPEIKRPKLLPSSPSRPKLVDMSNMKGRVKAKATVKDTVRISRVHGIDFLSILLVLAFLAYLVFFRKPNKKKNAKLTLENLRDLNSDYFTSHQ
jgi:hypothetical protein